MVSALPHDDSSEWGRLRVLDQPPEPVEPAASPWRAPTRVPLEHEERLSRSMIWDVNRRFFDSHGVKAWNGGHVPSYVTTNARIAGAYAEVVDAFCRDLRVGAVATREPVTVLELGAGAGRLGFLLLRSLRRMRGRDGAHEPPIRYVMTDFAEANVDAWTAHPRLIPLFETGELDVAVFDAAAPGPLELRVSGETIARFPGSLVIIANYVFDTLPADCFSVSSGQLFEKVVSVTGPGDVASTEDIADLELTYRLRGVPPGTFYGDAALDAVLEHYASAQPDGDVLVPVAGLRCLRHLAEAARGPTLLLAADKGHLTPADVGSTTEPQLARHGGCFSLMVNFDAIARYVEHLDGIALRPACTADHLQVAAFGLGAPSSSWPRTARAFDDHVGRFGPDAFFTLKRVIDDHIGELGVSAILAYLELAAGDRDCFLAAYPRLLELADGADDAQRRRLLRAATDLWEHDFPIGDASDLPFCLGMLLSRLRYFPEAARLFEASLELHGPDPRTYLQLAICTYSLHDLELARELVEAALRLDPGEPTARSILLTIRSELAERWAPDQRVELAPARLVP